MTIFRYDHTFEGLLTCLFEAYRLKAFPDQLLREGEPLPLFCDAEISVATDEEKAGRVWRGLQKRLSSTALSCLTHTWLSQLPEAPMLLLRYMRKAVDSPQPMETNFADPDVLALMRVSKQVSWEGMRLKQFIRFQKAADGTYFAPVEPRFNTLPLVIDHFRDRFADQRWLLYDTHRQYGYYYDLHTVTEVTFDDPNQAHLVNGILDRTRQAADEQLIQQLWKTYFKAICIRERLNPRKHRQDMPVRYWKYITEKQQ